MAISIVSTWPAAQNNNSFVASLTRDVTGATTNIIVVAWQDDTNSVTSVTDNQSNTYSPVMTFNTGDDIAIYVANNITTSASQFVTASMAHSSTCAVCGISVAGLSATTPFDQGTFTDTNTGTSWTSGNTGAARDANILLVGAANWYSGTSPTITAGSGYTTRAYAGAAGAAGIYMETKIVTGASGSQVATATSNASIAYTLFCAIFGDGSGIGSPSSSPVPHSPPPIYIFS